MKPKQLLFSTEGEIDRSEFLLGGCALFGPGVIIANGLVAFLSWSAFRIIDIGAPGSQVLGSILFVLPSLIRSYFGPVYLLLCLVPLYCLVRKRCRDRNRGTWVSVLYTIGFYVPAVSSTIYLSILMANWIGVSTGFKMVQLLFVCLCIVAAVDLLLLRGRERAAPLTAT